MVCLIPFSTRRISTTLQDRSGCRCATIRAADRNRGGRIGSACSLLRATSSRGICAEVFGFPKTRRYGEKSVGSEDPTLQPRAHDSVCRVGSLDPTDVKPPTIHWQAPPEKAGRYWLDELTDDECF